ncbi:hypothetical protein PBCV1_A310L [Paramecium bursaria Chlorella virus 1]|uniref:Penton capsid protein P1 n=1 Tax=Paramecium bursaria Chlorella virus 1 TaxID=10506 RepID=PENTA_PBCV1|nr:hypothetical protein PBCV1_A310L [Paramecium bursaria Chlorella virus 1]AAC96678.1 hypothetical protein [Paramecium bursaria Chlorella virus 1]6NCL_a6 Chain a6, P1 [Paramecium bursaria Chlorella virus 1]
MVETTQHFVSIESSNRPDPANTTPANYSIQLPQRYRNIWSAMLVNIALPAVSPPQKYVYLDIDKLNSIDSTSPSGGVNFALAKIPLSIAGTGNVFFADTMTSSFPNVPLQNPVATMDKLNIKLKDANGNVLTIPAGNEHSFMIQLTCGDYIPRGGGSTITQNGRVLGGTR